MPALIPIIWAFTKANWKAVLIGSAILAILTYHWNAVRQAKREGYSNALEDVDATAKKLEGQADEGAKTVKECFAKGEPWIWDRSTGKCVQQ